MQNNEGWFCDLLTNVLIIGLSQVKTLKEELLTDKSPFPEDTPDESKDIIARSQEKPRLLPKSSPGVNLNFNDDEISARPLTITL